MIIVNTMLSYIVKHTHIQQSCVLTSTKYVFKHILCVLYSVIIIKFSNLARDLYMIIGIVMKTPTRSKIYR